MKSNTLIFLFLLLNSVLVQVNSLKCGENEIENCKECGEDEESDTCLICQDHYYPLLENFICMACNDPIYSQTGCKTECISIIDTCQECKEGYEKSIDGLCIEKDKRGCVSFKSDNGVLSCQKCINEKEYIIDNDNFGCIKCNEKYTNCKECHLDGKDTSKLVCDQCLDDYYLDILNKCQACSYQNIDGGKCFKCPSDLKKENCYCNKGYTLFEDSCIECENNCDRCELGKDNTNKCVICSKGYVLNSENECVECENGCLYCYLENNKQKCFICPSQTFLTEDYKCLSSLLDNCYLTEYDSINKKVICIQCNSNYVIDPTTKECKPCSEISEIGEGYDNCIYNDTSKQYECSKCSNSHCYVDNTFKCLPKTNENGLNHCAHALHIKGEKYECVQCESYNYFLIKPDNICVLLSSYDFNQNCLEYEKKNENDYSCLKCLSVYAIVEDISSHIKDCLPRVDSLSYCLEEENKNDEFSCTRCVNNSSLNNKNCVCNSDSFSKDSNWCYKCNDDKNGGIKGCNEVTRCNYDPVNKVTCNQCKDGYYKTTQGKCA